ncbi:MAG: ABC-ATPase domain-containing protein [Nitrospirales bacterium]
MKTLNDLRLHLARIDGRGYKAYKDIAGAYAYDGFILFIDHVQGDPFAAPSKIRVRVKQQVANFPTNLWSSRVRRIAFCDFLARVVHHHIQEIVQGPRGIGKSGLISIDVGGQEILERTAVILNKDWVEARLEVGLPALGRTVLGKQAEAMLCHEVPNVIQQSLFWAQTAQQSCQSHVDYAENYNVIQGQLARRGLIAFVADGSILPRTSGASAHPLSSVQAKPFQSPGALQVMFEVPHPVSQGRALTRTITGLGIAQGITLIVGGGYHGKSTLLQALQYGVYPHVPGDGREYVVTSPDAVKVRAEDGRRIVNVDISGFINNLPQQQSTTCFSTDNASGSTSQAASILEALEVGTSVLLLDEDTSATNFLVRDARMQALVSKAHEPITSFLDRVHELYEQLEMSTIMVMGGCGDYFDVANTVILMKDFQPVDVTSQAKDITRAQPTVRHTEITSHLPSLVARVPAAESLNPSRGQADVKITARALDEIDYGAESIHLEAIEQLVDISQTRAVGYALFLISQKLMNETTPLKELLVAWEGYLNREGIDLLSPFLRSGQHPGNLARPRSYEVAAALNRLRTIRFEQLKG